MKSFNSTLLRKRIRDRKGGALVTMIAVMLILGVLGVTVVTLVNTTEYSHLSANAGNRAYYLAESGLRYAQVVHCNQFLIDEEGWRHGRQRTLSLLGGEQVDVIRLFDTFWATAIVHVGTAQEARARIPMPLSLCGIDPDNNPADEFAVFGDTAIALGNNTLIQGDVAITGDDVTLRGDIIGNVLADDITTTASGDTTITGNIISSGLVDIRTGTVTGDIHADIGIQLRSTESSIFDGWLFSNGYVDLSGSAQVLGHVHACGGDVIMDGSSIIGTAAEPVEVRASGDVDMSGSAIIYGNVYAGGNIIVGNNNSIVGNAYAAGTITRPENITGTAFPNSPTYVLEAICPDLSDLDDLNLPDAAVFTSGGDDHIVPLGTMETPTNYYLAPGSHGNLTMPSIDPLVNLDYTKLYLTSVTGAEQTDHAYYYFDSIDIGDYPVLYLDMSGTWDIRIFTTGNVDFGEYMTVYVSTDGSTYLPMDDATVDPHIAERVYWESSADFSLGARSNWFGTVYTPLGNLGVGNRSYLIGSYYSGGGHSIQGSEVLHMPANYFQELAEEE